MPETRYFLPDHPELEGEYSRDDLRLLLREGKLSRSDMVIDDQTGLAHLLGALLASPYYLSPHAGRGRAAEDEEKPEDAEGQSAPALEEKSAAPSSAVSEEPDLDEPEDGGHVEFRAATPLRQWESPALEVDHYGEEEQDEDVDDGEADDDEFEDEEEEGIPQAHVLIPPSAPRQEQPQEEELLYQGHPSWLSYPKSLAAFMALAAAAILCQRMHVGVVWCVTAAALSLLCLAFVALDRMTTEYFITSRRVEVESGLIGRSTKEIRIADIRAIDVTQVGFNAVIGVGTLEFYSSAGGQADVCFANVYRPHRLKQTVRDLQL